MTSSDQDYDREGVSKSSNYTLILLESLNLPIICINTIGGTIGLCICIDKYCSGLVSALYGSSAPQYIMCAKNCFMTIAAE